MPEKFEPYVSRIALFTSRVLKTDGRYLLSGGFWSIVGQGAAMVCSLTLAVVVARFVPKDVYGDYKYVLAVVAICAIFSLNDIATAVFQSVASGFDGAIFEGFRLNLRWSAIAVISAVAVAAYYAFAHDLALAFCILLGGCVMPFQNGSNLFISFLNGKHDFGRSTIYSSVFGNIVPAVILIVTAIFLPNLIALGCAYFLGNLAIDLYFYLRTIELYKPDERKRDPGLRHYGLHLSAIGVLGGIAGNIDSVLVFHFVGSINLAIYSFAIGILDQAKGPAKMLDNMMLARFARRDDADIERSIGNKMFWMFVGGAVIICVFWFAAPLLYKLFFPAYIASIPYARLYSFNLLGLAVSPIGSYFSAHKKIKEQYIANVGGNAIIIVFMFAGVILWGLWGLVAARVASSFASSLLSLILYWYATRKSS